jgi:hypothetical protein
MPLWNEYADRSPMRLKDLAELISQHFVEPLP